MSREYEATQPKISKESGPVYLEIQAYNDGMCKQTNKEDTNIKINDFPISYIFKPAGIYNNINHINRRFIYNDVEDLPLIKFEN